MLSGRTPKSSRSSVKRHSLVTRARARRRAARMRSGGFLNWSTYLGRALFCTFLLWIATVLYFINQMSLSPEHVTHSNATANVRKRAAQVSKEKHHRLRPKRSVGEALNLKPKKDNAFFANFENAEIIEDTISEKQTVAQTQVKSEVKVTETVVDRESKLKQRFFKDIILPEFKTQSDDSELNSHRWDQVFDTYWKSQWKPETELKAISDLRERITELSKEFVHVKDETKKDIVEKVAVERNERYKCLHYCEDVHNYACVLKQMQYWSKGNERVDTLISATKSSTQASAELMRWVGSAPVFNAKYPMLATTQVASAFSLNSAATHQGFLTFKNDCGGFNNIRQAFEYFVTVAWLTQRTLVLPVTEGWYLIDWGPMKRAVPQNTAGVSNYWHFFEMADLSKAIDWANMTQFLDAHWHNLQLPTDHVFERQSNPSGVTRICEHWNWDTRQRFKQTLNEKAVSEGFALNWGPLSEVLLWPNISTVLNSANSKQSHAEWQYHDTKTGKAVDLNTFIGRRHQHEYVENGFSKKPFLHFPSCHENRAKLRYLSQVASTTAFAEFDTEKKFKRLIRDHVHLRNEAFEVAAHVVAELGLFRFHSAHIRRNDFQFKQSWVDPMTSFKHMTEVFDSLQNGGNRIDTLYIASDAPSAFFANVSAVLKGRLRILRWQHFFGNMFEPEFEDVAEKKAGENQFKGFEEKDIGGGGISRGLIGDRFPRLKVDRKMVGLIEMIICSGGHTFFGTSQSTFSAYIQRLRGYIDAPDKRVFHHNHKGEVLFDYRATEYMREFEDMWTDIKDYC